MTTQKQAKAALNSMPDVFGDVTKKPQPQLAKWYICNFSAIRAALRQASVEPALTEEALDRAMKALSRAIETIKYAEIENPGLFTTELFERWVPEWEEALTLLPVKKEGE